MITVGVINPHRFCFMDTVITHTGKHIFVVRHDKCLGGSKAQVLPDILRRLDNGRGFVYASPAYGYAQVAATVSVAAVDSTLTVFTAARAKLTTMMSLVTLHGGSFEYVRPGYLNVVQKRAADHAARFGKVLLPFGLRDPEMHAGLVRLAREECCYSPSEVWLVAGSGVLWRALADAWPLSFFNVVQIGKDLDTTWCGSLRYRVWIAPEKFEQESKYPPPFPSALNYDAKAWRFICEYASDNSLFWNVAG